jgi:hypothetical protein
VAETPERHDEGGVAGTAEEIKRRTQDFRTRAERAYARRGRLLHVLWVVAAVALLLAGLAMTVLPGPAIVVVPIALAMLSVQFSWAGRLVDTGLDRGSALASWVARARWRSALFVLLAGVGVAFAVVAAVRLA